MNLVSSARAPPQAEFARPILAPAISSTKLAWTSLRIVAGAAAHPFQTSAHSRVNHLAAPSDFRAANATPG